MNKIKLFFVRFWSFLKRLGFYLKLGYIRTAALVVKARRGDALEFHPLVGKTANIVFKVIFGLAVFVFAIGAAFAIGIYGYKQDDKATQIVAGIIPYPVAFAQGRIVTADDFFANYRYINNFYQKTQQSDVDYDAIKAQVLQQLIDNELLKSQAKKYGVSVKRSDIETAYSEVVSQNGGEEEVKKVLADLYGLNVKEFKNLIADQILEQKLAESVPIQVRARHILIRVDKDAAQDKVDETKSRMDKVLEEIRGGLNFSEAATKYSEDTGSNQNGGDLDFFTRGQLEENFEKVAFETEVGKVSDPFRTEFGWHILLVEEKKGQVDMSFSDWLDSLRKNGTVLEILRLPKNEKEQSE